MGQFEGKKVLITGAARGIGQSTALKFAAQGADLLLCDLQAEWLEDTASKAKALGADVQTFSANVAIEDDVKRVVAEAHKIAGSIDILVNNAGITKDGLLIRMSEKDWDDVISVNLKGVFLFTRTVGKIMMKQRSGAIVNVASVIGLIGNAGQANYSASKAGVIALTKSSAKELASRGIRVNAVAPGFIKTKMTESLSEEVQQKMLDVIPMHQFGEPEDVANVISFLASGDAAYVTGQVLTVCGGMVT